MKLPSAGRQQGQVVETVEAEVGVIEMLVLKNLVCGGGGPQTLNGSSASTS